MENIDIESHNSILNLNTIAVVIGLLLIRVTLSCLLKLMLLLTDGVKCLEGLASKDLYWNTLLSLTLECFMDFVVCSYLNAQTLRDTKPLLGETLGIICWASVMTLLFIVLPVALLLLITIKPSSKELKKDKHKEVWGVLYEDLRTKSRFQLAFYLVFVIRRSVFLCVGLFIENADYKVWQLLAVFYLNICNSLYFGKVDTWIPRLYRRMEVVNEWFVGSAGAFLILYTEIGPDEQMKYKIGWIHILTISIFLLINLFLIFYDFGRVIILWIYWLSLKIAKYYAGVYEYYLVPPILPDPGPIEDDYSIRTS